MCLKMDMGSAGGDAAPDLGEKHGHDRGLSQWRHCYRCYGDGLLEAAQMVRELPEPEDRRDWDWANHIDGWRSARDSIVRLLERNCGRVSGPDSAVQTPTLRAGRSQAAEASGTTIGVPAKSTEPAAVFRDDDVCAWCNKTYAEHSEKPDPSGMVPRCPCLGLKRSFWRSATESPQRGRE
jgi:hypothetical protein